MKHSHLCIQCKQIFHTKYPQKYRKFCRRDCYFKSITGRPPEQHFSYRGTNLSGNCLKCNNTFNFYLSAQLRGGGKFCSQKCSQNYHKGDKHNMWKDGVCMGSDGYILINSPHHPYKDARNYVRQHRLVAEQHLKRFLSPKEVIHHINEIKNDNRLSNLYLFPTDKEHRAYHIIPNKKPLQPNLV